MPGRDPNPSRVDLPPASETLVNIDCPLTHASLTVGHGHYSSSPSVRATSGTVSVLLTFLLALWLVNFF